MHNYLMRLKISAQSRRRCEFIRTVKDLSANKFAPTSVIAQSNEQTLEQNT
jgi:hypothetical protein